MGEEKEKIRVWLEQELHFCPKFVQATQVTFIFIGQHQAKLMCTFQYNIFFSCILNFIKKLTIRPIVCEPLIFFCKSWKPGPGTIFSATFIIRWHKEFELTKPFKSFTTTGLKSLRAAARLLLNCPCQLLPQRASTCSCY